ncbi:LytR/AlgR family response regulator transcription factor [Flexithrix dorotheae]|uniref:LytR/AlgR family response regulator transcription factor n=1 Tax=Flexithrix dorotheae TaxID=70993 RepID=UPI00036F15A9|nr:LytTR family DNA-binding domain-containing protein [Flexithrix dorotheae]
MGKKLTCIIVDDDLMSLKIMETLVARNTSLDLVGKFENAIEAANMLANQPVDLIFLDVEMPEMTGLEFIKTLNAPPQIILTTSKEKYALEAFEYEVTDYLLKPIENYARFLKAVQRAQKNIEEQNSAKEEGDSLYVKVESLLENIKFVDIDFIEAAGDYVKIHTSKRMLLVYTTLRAVEKKLPESQFMRIHRSFIIRLDRIENIDISNLQIGRRIIPISNTYKNSLMERIKTL